MNLNPRKLRKERKVSPAYTRGYNKGREEGIEIGKRAGKDELREELKSLLDINEGGCSCC